MVWLRRSMYPLAGIILVLTLAYGFLPDPVPVDFGTVSRGAVRVVVEAEAATRVRDSFVVRAPAAGHMQRLPFKPGANVEPGQLLTHLRGAGPVLDARSLQQAQASVRSAEAAVQRAEAAQQGAAAEQEFAAAEHERARRLLEREMIAPEAADAAAMRARTAGAALRAAGFALEAARHQLDQARAALADGGNDELREIRAPAAGRVLRVLRESEGMVAPGEPLLEVGDVRQLEVVADLLSQDAVRVRPGMAVVIERWGGEPLAGRVREVEPGGFTHISALGVEEQRVNVLIDLVDAEERSGALGDGFRVEVTIVLQEVTDALRVPLAAVFRSQDGDAVFAANGGHAALRRVELGARSGMEAEVLAGLAEGERVIIHPSDAVRDGVTIRQR